MGVVDLCRQVFFPYGDSLIKTVKFMTYPVHNIYNTLLIRTLNPLDR